MQEPASLPTPERPDASASGRTGTSPAHGSDDSPTVRRAPAAGAPGSSVGSSARVEIVTGSGLAEVSMALPVPLPLPRPGDRIDMFDLEQAIGVGGMGAVFRALDTRLDRHVALKILPPEQAGDPEVVQRFYQEGRAAARLDHENIARVYTIGHDGRFHYIAFEYIEGTTARQRVEKNGPLPVGEAINYTLQIADALVHAAERGVVHRDIKPSNIIVTPHGRAKLVDMGLARRFERGGDDGLTQSGMTLGTFDYISPEQARDPRDVDVRSDLYSLGCTLFHMLTGRPPFPEGTVLQKLIQHQEEAPPDVRTLNANVPTDLANILVKLMAKDRDRRYQTPEQLVRDLLTVAGALGLRSVSPEGLVWLASDAPPGWERYLVWGVPTFVFAVIVGALVWWGQDPGKPLVTSPGDPWTAVSERPATPVVTVGDKSARPKEALQPAIETRSTTPGLAGTEPTTVGPKASAATEKLDLPRDLAVESTEDLLAVIARAPRRAMIRLVDHGPYLLGGSRSGRATDGLLTGRDVTIKADAGVRPVLRPAPDLPLLTPGRTALLDFKGGRVVLEGIEFAPDPSDPSGASTVAAVRAEDTELTIRRCSFRRPSSTTVTTRVPAFEPPVALDLTFRAPAATGDRVAAVTIEKSHFDGGQIGVRVTGPSDILLRDCTLAGDDPAVWLDNGRSPVPVLSDLRLRHVSALAGRGPVFRFEGSDPRVWVEDTVVASGSAADKNTTLVATDHPDTLAWRGRGNLYAAIATFLLPTDGRGKSLSDPELWAANDTREAGSSFIKQPVWEEPDPALTLAQETQNPTRAFRLAANPGPAAVGAREGPFGILAPAPRMALAVNTRKTQATANPRESAEAKLTGETNPVPAGRSTKPDAAASPGPRVAESPRVEIQKNIISQNEPNSAPAPGAGTTATRNDPGRSEETTSGLADAAVADATGSSRPGRSTEIPEMPVMPPTGADGRPVDARTDTQPPLMPPVMPPEKSAMDPTEPNDAAPVTTTAGTAVSPNPATAVETGATAIASVKSPGARPETGTLRTADQFLTALSEPGSRGGVLRVPSGADWEVPSTSVRATGSWRIQAEAGPTRPRLRFLPRAADPNSPTSATMLSLHSGSLQLDGFDILLPRERAPRQGRWAAFAVSPGAELSLTNCTVTIEGDGLPSAVVVVTGTREEVDEGVNAPETAAVTVRMTDTLIRAGGDLVDLGGGHKLSLEMDDTAIATGGSIIHAHGIPRGQLTESISLTLRQVTARAAGGLVRLASSVGEPELPTVEIKARFSVLTTGSKEAPLLVVDGQDAPDAMRNRIHWEGQGVAYHQVNVYRRDQSSQLGSSPVLYDRASWSVAAGPHDKDALYGDVKFLRESDPGRPAWSLDKDAFRLGDDTPARSSGSDLSRIPEPPPVS